MAKEKDKNKKIKLAPLNMVLAWNVFNELDGLTQDPAYTGWVKRIRAYFQPEVVIWNDLTEDERKKNIQKELSFPVDKIPANNLPEPINEYQARILEPCVEGKIKVYKPQLKKSK